MQKSVAVLFVSIIVGVCACQNESETIRLPANADAFKSGSSAATAIIEATTHDGSYDDILDGASCTSIVLPATVVVSGQQIVVGSTDDLKFVERAIDDHGGDDGLTFVFPVTVMLSDFEQVVANNEAGLAALTKNCVGDGSDDDNECVDFVYPIEISIYDTSNQLATSVTITDDHGLYEFIHNIKEGEFVSIQFPVIMKLVSGSSITINDNISLTNYIQDAKNDCDEKDNVSFSDDDIDDSNLRGVLTSGNWTVDYYFLDSDQTSQFSGFVFSYGTDGKTVAMKGDATVNGTWATYGDQGELELDLDYDKYNDSFDKIGEDWTVTNLTASSITLHTNSHGQEGMTLILKKK